MTSSESSEWEKMFDSEVGLFDVYEGDRFIACGLFEKDADAIIADHAKAAQVDALNKRLFELQWSVANESDLAVKQSARADKAEAKVDALVARLAYINVWAQMIDADRTLINDPKALEDLFSVLNGEDKGWLEKANETTDQRDALLRLLRHLEQWDHMQSAGDGPYWLKEIATALGEDKPYPR